MFVVELIAANNSLYVLVEGLLYFITLLPLFDNVSAGPDSIFLPLLKLTAVFTCRVNPKYLLIL